VLGDGPSDLHGGAGEVRLLEGDFELGEVPRVALSDPSFDLAGELLGSHDPSCVGVRIHEERFEMLGT